MKVTDPLMIECQNLVEQINELPVVKATGHKYAFHMRGRGCRVNEKHTMYTNTESILQISRKVQNALGKRFLDSYGKNVFHPYDVKMVLTDMYNFLKEGN